jgi:signal transduction histidine kinase
MIGAVLFIEIGPVTPPDVAGLIMIAGSVPALYLASCLWDERTKPGVIWFITAMIAVGAYSLTYGLHSITDGATSTVVLRRLVFVFVMFAGISWFLLAIEYTFKKPVPWSTALPFFVLFGFIQTLVWINPGNLVFAEGTHVASGGYLRPEWGPLYFLDAGYNILLMLFAIGIWFGEWMTSRGRRRKQTGIFLVASGVLLFAGVLHVAELFPPFFDPVPMAFLVSGGLITYALTEFQLLRTVPIARETTVEKLNDAVIVIDDNDQIIDVNAATQAFLPASSIGRDYRTVLDAFPSLLETLESDATTDEIVEIVVDGRKQYFFVNIYPVDYGRNLQGRIVVLRDVTELKKREEDLDLLKQILTRVLRHNIRNDLTPITGFATVLQKHEDETVRKLAGKIHDNATHLHDQSEKAYEIEKVVALDQTRTQQLPAVLEKVMVTQRENHPDAIIAVSADDVAIDANPKLPVAIRELVENAIEHHDNDEPEITIYTEDHEDSVSLLVEDNGPGLPQEEIDVLQSEEETALQHVSGVGLWLVRWVVEQSNGDLVPERTVDGTRVRLRLPKANSDVEETDGTLRPNSLAVFR